MSATSFFGGAFFGGEYFKTPTPTVRTIDTHDGFDNRRDDEERLKKEALRQMIGLAVDPEGYAPPAEVMELAEPFVERLESGRVEIDWKRLEREIVIREQLYALADQFRRDMEEDEEDVLTLILH